MAYVGIDCPLCGGNRFLRAGSWLSEGREVHLVVCETCAHLYQNPRPDQEEMEEFYRHQYAATGQQMLDDYADDKYRWLCSNFGMESLKEGRFLEIGSWAGFLLNRLRGEGVDVYGLEPSDKAAKWQKEQFDLKVENTFIEESKYPPGFFRHIVAFQVLEHLRDPVAALKKMRSMLAEGGRILVEAPSLFYCNSVFHPDFSFMPCPRHMHIFSPHSLSRAFAAAGLRVMGAESRPYWLKVWGEASPNASASAADLKGEDPRKILRCLRRYAVLKNFYYRPKFALRNVCFRLLGKDRCVAALRRLRGASGRRIEPANQVKPANKKKSFQDAR